jgi:hypothetical protein
MRIKLALVLAAATGLLMSAVPASATTLGSVGREAKAADVAGALVDQVHRRRWHGHRHWAFRNHRHWRGHWRPRYYGYYYRPYPYYYYPYYSNYVPYYYRPYRYHRRPHVGIYLSF